MYLLRNLDHNALTSNGLKNIGLAEWKNLEILFFKGNDFSEVIMTIGDFNFPN